MKHTPLFPAPLLLGFFGLMACAPRPDAPPPEEVKSASPAPLPAAVATEAPAGEYRIDASHTSVTFRVNHTGFSEYTGGFDKVAANLTLDTVNPEKSSLTATVDVRSLDIPTPPQGFLNDMLGELWFDAARHPEMTFVSTSIERTGADTARVQGNLTLRGVTKPAVFDVKFNGGYAGMAVYDPNARIGFSAMGNIKRSDFGMTYGIPEPGSKVGVGDEVLILIETEFTGPPLKP
ncbi:YceI family protein [Asticcacaulis tiandongensis]|uniref:YceI family protein n=1 Tax=Asticcacaulis tiandongensis TaxID=2565365 RepID=UPI00112DF320|nr:YceI family protein [Asticcacaulis tiandongensis]